MENIATIKEILGTLNLESETATLVLEELMPLLWWTLVWLPILEIVGFGFFLLTLMWLGFKGLCHTINN